MMKGKRNISENEKLHFGLEQIFHPMDIDRIYLHVSDSDLGCNDTMRCNGEGNINTDSIFKNFKGFKIFNKPATHNQKIL